MSDLAKVVKVIDAYRVVINRGAVHGVARGDRYLVYQLGEELFDPDTNETLGRVEVVRGRGEVTHVQDRLSTLTSVETTRVTRKWPYADLAGSSDVVYEKEPFQEAQLGDIARHYTSTAGAMTKMAKSLTD